MPSSSETNNTAEYSALLLGSRAAADHGATSLRVEGDSTLVIQQVRGIFAARNAVLRRLRDQVKVELARVGSFSLHHNDRQANAHADRLANQALDLRRTVMECGVHTAGDGCTNTTLDPMPVLLPQPTPRTPPPTPAADTNTEMQEPEDEDLADIDDGEVYAAMRIGPDAVPQRRPRLRLRQLTEAEDDAAREMVERLGATLAAKITDASDWESAEGYITALPHLLYDKLQPYSQAQRRPEPPRRRVGRVNSAIDQQHLRHRFDTDEKACVEDILAKARAQQETPRTAASSAGTASDPAAPAAGATDDGTCPIPGDELWRYFDGVNTPSQEFAPDAPAGAAFRSAMTHLPAASRFRELLTEAPTQDDI
ncbi:hypothetical protein PHYSODRAFT_533596, partial [Phytophthora sojae]